MSCKVVSNVTSLHILKIMERFIYKMCLTNLVNKKGDAKWLKQLKWER